MGTTTRAGSTSIANAIREDIKAGIFLHNDRLPPERELATRFDAARGTIRESLKHLEEYLFHLIEFFHLLGSEIALLLPVLLDLIELKLVEGFVGDQFPVSDAEGGVAVGRGDMGSPEERD